MILLLRQKHVKQSGKVANGIFRKRAQARIDAEG